MYIFGRPIKLKHLLKLKYLLFCIIKRIMDAKVFYNLCLYCISIFFKKSKPLNKPFYLMIETSSFCQVSCAMCHRNLFGFSREQRNIKLNEFTKIIDECGDYLLFVALYNFGEPLLNPEIDEIIKLCSKKNIITVLSTNGLLLDEEMAYKIISAGLKYLIVSMPGIDQKTYNLYVKEGNFEILQKNIWNLSKIKKKIGVNFPVVDLQLIVLKENEHQIEKFLKLSRDLEVERASLKSLCILMKYENKNLLLPKDKKFAISSYFDKSALQKRKFCPTPYRSMLINSDGKVYPCCWDYFCVNEMGDAFKESLLSIWRNKEYAGFRMQIKNSLNKTMACRDCPNTIGEVGKVMYAE